MSNDKQVHGSAFEVMNTFLHEVDMVKEASNLDLAGDAKSTHPSANVDDGTRPASEGSRSSENESDVKKSVPDTINDESSKNEAGGSEKPTDTQGTISQGSDDGLQGNVDSPKKDHSKSMSDSGPGDDTFDGSWDKASAALAKQGNDIVASLAVLLKQAEAPAPEAVQVAEKTNEKEASADPEVALYKEAAEQYPDAMEAGYASAMLLAQQLGAAAEKSAADESAMIAGVAGIRKEAAADADKYIEFLTGYQNALSKAAQGPEELAALANAGGGMPPEMMAGGGAPQAEELAGLGAEEAEAGAEDEEASLEEIAAALDEAGITPEELAAAVAEAQGGEVPEEGGEEMAEGEAEDLGEEGSAEGEEGGMIAQAAAGRRKTSVKKASANKAALINMLRSWQ